MLDKKIKKLKELLKNKNIAVAFSGGVDSTLLLKIAKEVSNEVIAVTVDIGAIPKNQITEAKKIAREIGVKHKIIKENFLEYEWFQHEKYRCYFCKKRMYKLIKNFVGEKFEIIDGTNVTDMLEDRPGIVANYEENIKSPLVEAQISHDEAAEYLKNKNIRHLKDTTCLATRVKKGKLTKNKIKRINKAENIVKKFFAGNIRVRDLDGIAVIEAEKFNIDEKILEKLCKSLKKLGFKKVLLDIEGYKKKYNIKQKNNELIVTLPYQINLKDCKERYVIKKGKIYLDSGVVILSKNGKIHVKSNNPTNTLFKVLSCIRRDSI
nr:ATP-dependent sacrificial sulfur transferase LarE [Methanothermus fervidus]